MLSTLSYFSCYTSLIVSTPFFSIFLLRFFFFFNDTATTEIYTLSLHDALPISFCVLLQYLVERRRVVTQLGKLDYDATPDRKSGSAGMPRPISYAVFCLKKKKKKKHNDERQSIESKTTKHCTTDIL